MKKYKKKKKFSTSNYVVGSMAAGNVAGTLAQSTGSTTGSTMTANMMKGAAKPIVPVMKVKGSMMVLEPIKKMTKGVKKLKFKGAYEL